MNGRSLEAMTARLLALPYGSARAMTLIERIEDRYGPAAGDGDLKLSGASMSRPFANTHPERWTGPRFHADPKMQEDAA